MQMATIFLSVQKFGCINVASFSFCGINFIILFIK